MSLTTNRPRTDDEPYRVLDDEGHLLPDAEPPDISDERLLYMYEQLRLARRFDERAVSLQRGGRIATYAPMAGQAGTQVASAMALSPEDWCYPTYRDHAAKLVHGLPLESLLLSLMGHGDGHHVPEGVNLLPETIPIATQIPQATGTAWAARLKGEPRAVLCYFGDGATSEGDFHEGLNIAGVMDTPAVFLCNNNRWAISVPFDRQTAVPTIAQKAAAYGFEGIRVDGMDPLAVYEVTSRAVAKAKHPDPGELRPTLIEAVTTRFGAHSTADDPSVYRDDVPQEELDRDPLPRLETYLRDEGLLDDERVDAIGERIEERIAEAVAAAEAREDHPDAMFEHVFAEPTPQLRRQREQVRERMGE